MEESLVDSWCYSGRRVTHCLGIPYSKGTFIPSLLLFATQITWIIMQEEIAITVSNSWIVRAGLCCFLSETGFCTPPPLEGKIATDTLTPSFPQWCTKIRFPWEEGIYTSHWSWGWNSAVKFQKNQYHHSIKSLSPSCSPAPKTFKAPTHAVRQSATQQGQRLKGLLLGSWDGLLPVLRIIFHPVDCPSETGPDRKILSKETWFSLQYRGVKGLEIAARPGAWQKSLPRKAGVRQERKGTST